MRKQLDKELALAMLLGDGRDVSDQYKINDDYINLDMDDFIKNIKQHIFIFGAIIDKNI